MLFQLADEIENRNSKRSEIIILMIVIKTIIMIKNNHDNNDLFGIAL